jgi:O-acetyl-ADP-ribose deacetylase (regulator of RNase III)
MLSYIRRNVVDVKMGIIAHGVNCNGALGSGVAGALRRKWPEVYYNFKSQPTGRRMLGEVRFVHINDMPGLIVANCYTQESYGRDGKRYASLDAIEKALSKVFDYADMYDWWVFMPRIGCGLGGLDWEAEVGPAINHLMENHENLRIYICDI